jgi:DNA (cytosine-5)-methyltransferase 1
MVIQHTKRKLKNPYSENLSSLWGLGSSATWRASMTTIINTKIGEAKSGVSRIWIEGQKLLHAGVRIGEKYVLRSDERTKRIELVPSNNHAAGETVFTVSKRERNGTVLPLLEIRSSILEKFYSGCEKVRVAIRNGRIIVSALQVDMKIKERVDRLKRKLATKEKLTSGSIFHGAGILDKAIHSGLLAAGVAAFIQVGVEIESEYLDTSLRNNSELWSADSIAICSDIRDVSLGGSVPQLDIGIFGVPCTGASRAGASKNKLEFAEEHSSAGTLFFDTLEFIKATNPAIVAIENVSEYAKSASMAVIRSVLTSLGYNLHEQVLFGPDFGTIEARKRMCLVAITKGLCEGDVGFVFPDSHPSVVAGQSKTLADVLEDVPLDSDSWKSYEYLSKKEILDIASGKGFRRQLVNPEAKTVGTITRGYSKVRSTDPFLIHPTNPELSRLFTPVEHARIKGVPEHVILGVAATTAHEILGQSVCYPVFESVGFAIGAAIQGMSLPQTYLTSVDPVTDYCGQICGGGECGTGPVCSMGIDPETHMPPLFNLVNAA